jgi:multidrug resistance protein
MQSSSLKQLSVLMTTVFVDMVGFTMVLPLLAFYATDLGANASVLGVLVAIYAFAQFITAPFWGRSSDRYGRRPVILIGLLLSASAYVLFGLAHALWILFLSRLVQGAGGGITGVVQAYVADAVEPEERAKALGWISAATSAGVMIGPALGSLAARLSNEAPGFIAAGLCIVNVLCAWRWLPEPQRAVHTDTATPPAPRKPLLRSFWEVLSHPSGPVSSLIWIYAIGMMGFMAMNTVLALYLKDAFGVTKETIGFIYPFFGLVSVIMRALLLGPAVRRFGEVGVTRLGAITLVVGLAGIPLPNHLLGLIPVALLVPVGTALLFPATTALVSRRSARGETGQVLGVQQSFGSIARMVGPLGSGFVFQQMGMKYPFWLAALLMLGVSLLTLRQKRGEPRSAPVVAEPEKTV